MSDGPMNDSIQATTAPAPVGIYPHARRVGELLFLSGIGPRSPGSNEIPGNVHGADGAYRHVCKHGPVMAAEEVAWTR